MRLVCDRSPEVLAHLTVKLLSGYEMLAKGRPEDTDLAFAVWEATAVEVLTAREANPEYGLSMYDADEIARWPRERLLAELRAFAGLE